MTRKEFKKGLVDAYIVDTINDNDGEFVGTLLTAIENLYVTGLIKYATYRALNDYVYDGTLEEDAYKARPDLFVKLSAKGKIRKVVN